MLLTFCLHVWQACHQICINSYSTFQSTDNQDGSDWRDEDEKLPGHENLTEKDIELFRHIQELALQVRRYDIMHPNQFLC